MSAKESHRQQAKPVQERSHVGCTGMDIGGGLPEPL
jgi:hypothetical protein